MGVTARRRDYVLALILWGAVGLVGAITLAVLLPQLPGAITAARAFAHATACTEAQTSPPSCLLHVHGVVTNNYEETGSRSGTTYYLSVTTDGGRSFNALEIQKPLFYAVQNGFPADIELFGDHAAYVTVAGVRGETSDTPANTAGGLLFGAGFGLLALFGGAGGAGLRVLRRQASRLPLSLDRGPVIYRPSPTRLSAAVRTAVWGLPALIPLACGLTADQPAFYLIALAMVLGGIAVVVATNRGRLTLTRDGLSFRAPGRKPVDAAWPSVRGVALFGSGRNRYPAIAMVDGRKIRYQVLTRFTAANASLEATIYANSGGAAVIRGLPPPPGYGWPVSTFPPASPPAESPYAPPGIDPYGAATPPEPGFRLDPFPGAPPAGPGGYDPFGVQQWTPPSEPPPGGAPPATGPPAR